MKKSEHFYSAVISIFLRRIGRIDGPCSTKLWHRRLYSLSRPKWCQRNSGRLIFDWYQEMRTDIWKKSFQLTSKQINSKINKHQLTNFQNRYETSISFSSIQLKFWIAPNIRDQTWLADTTTKNTKSLRIIEKIAKCNRNHSRRNGNFSFGFLT